MINGACLIVIIHIHLNHRSVRESKRLRAERQRRRDAPPALRALNLRKLPAQAQEAAPRGGAAARAGRAAAEAVTKGGRAAAAAHEQGQGPRHRRCRHRGARGG